MPATAIQTEAPSTAAGLPDVPLEACDEDLDAQPRRYCPTELLASFTLLMAGHGRCVHAAMMLGDREYAMWQLAHAQALGDPQLAQVAARLFAWFDRPRTPGALA